MANANGLSQRRGSHSNSSDSKPENGAAHDHHQDHGDHQHSHGVFSSHSHSHGEHDHDHDGGAEEVMKALTGSGDRGSRITLIGLFSNVGLTISKGAAGYYMNSASLLADAGHSASDLLGDFVTLFCWKLSRRPPSQRYPYGFAKFETLGTSTVALLLIGGALGIGVHSAYLLADALSATAATLPPGPLQTALENITEAAHILPDIGHSHGHHAGGHGHGGDGELDPNAAWFALLSVGAKEWLYRATKRVATEERSPVLLANALHHRSDVWSSLVALFAIAGTWYFPALPLDPIGGFLVSIVILQQGYSLLAGAFGELTDAGVSPRTLTGLDKAIRPLVRSSSSPSSTSTATTSSLTPPTAESILLGVSDIRARRSGALTFVDMTAQVPAQLSVTDAAALEARIERTVKQARTGVAEVRVRFEPVAEEGDK